MPMSSPQMTRMFGLSDLGISHSLLSLKQDYPVNDNLRRGDIAANSAFSCPLTERTDVKRHADNRCDADHEQNERGDQCQRHRKHTFGTNESLLPHRLPHVAKAQHELDMIDDPEDQHRDAQHDKSKAEIAWRLSFAYDVLLPQPLKKLEDREAEADQRQRSADDRHQRAVRAHARALKRHAGAARCELGVDVELE